MAEAKVSKLAHLARVAAELPAMDDALDALIARAHQVDPEAEVVELEDKRAAPPPPRIEARPAVPAPPPAARRVPWLAIGGAFAAGLAIALGIVGATRSSSEPPTAPAAAPITPAAAPITPTPVPVIAPPPPRVPPPPSEPAAVASPRPVRKHLPTAADAPTPDKPAALIDPFAAPRPAPARPSKPGKPAAAPQPPRGELIDPFQSP
jgi:hypothetical protein